MLLLLFTYEISYSIYKKSEVKLIPLYNNIKI